MPLDGHRNPTPNDPEFDPPRDAIEALDSQFERREAELIKLTTTRDLVKLRAIIEGCPELLDDRTDLRLRQTLMDSKSVENVLDQKLEDYQKEFLAETIGWTLGLVRRCREVGTAKTFDELASGVKLETQPTLCSADLESIMNLAVGARQEYKLSGDTKPLERAIETYAALISHPSFERSRPLCRVFMLDNAAFALLDLHERSKRPNALSTAIEYLERAVSQTPEESVDYPLRTWQLSRAYEIRFEEEHLEADLMRSLQAFDALLGLARNGSASGLAALEAKGPWLRKTYRDTNRVEWLDREITTYELQLASSELKEEVRVPLVVNLGDALRVRYEHLKDTADLTNAINQLEEAVPKMPRTQWRSVAQGNLGYVLLLRFRASRSRPDLERARALFEDALGAAEVSNDEKPRLAQWLLESLYELESLTGEPSDPEAIAALKRFLKTISAARFTDFYDELMQSAGAEQTEESGEVTGGLRLFQQNKAMQRLRFESRYKMFKGVSEIVIFGFVALLFMAVAAGAWVWFGSRWIAALTGVVGAAIFLIGGLEGGLLCIDAAGCKKSLRGYKKLMQSWDDQEARSILQAARTADAPFALFLRGFEDEASDRALDLEKWGPIFFQNISPRVGSTELNVKKTLAEHLAVITIANPADLLILIKREAIPRIVLPAKNWESIVAKLMDAAALVLVECEEFSPGVIAELGILSHFGHTRKTVVVIPEEGDDKAGVPLNLVAMIVQAGSQLSGPPLQTYARATIGDPRLQAFPNVIRGSELSWPAIEQMRIV